MTKNDETEILLPIVLSIERIIRVLEISLVKVEAKTSIFIRSIVIFPNAPTLWMT